MKALNIYCFSLLFVLPVAGFAQDDLSTEDADTAVVRHIRKTAKKQEPTREIKGHVISQQGHTPLAGVLVQSMIGDGYSTLTDENGDFTMKVPLYCSAVNVTLPGYNSVRVGLNKSGQLPPRYRISWAPMYSRTSEAVSPLQAATCKLGALAVI